MTVDFYRRSYGFTMIELMVTLVVLGILLGVGVPSFRLFLVNARTSAVANDITSAINLARSEAVKRAEPVTVCPSDDGADCDGAWTDGWIVRLAAGGDPLRVWREPAAGTDITQTPAANRPIDFGALGERITGDTALVMQVEGCRGQRARRLEIGPAGRVSVQRVACDE
jgi:type IV fimbrial biogenesis protein FimT